MKLHLGPQPLDLVGLLVEHLLLVLDDTHQHVWAGVDVDGRVADVVDAAGGVPVLKVLGAEEEVLDGHVEEH